jgi:hypothetical protein
MLPTNYALHLCILLALIDHGLFLTAVKDPIIASKGMTEANAVKLLVLVPELQLFYRSSPWRAKVTAQYQIFICARYIAL